MDGKLGYGKKSSVGCRGAERGNAWDAVTRRYVVGLYVPGRDAVR